MRLEMKMKCAITLAMCWMACAQMDALAGTWTYNGQNTITDGMWILNVSAQVVGTKTNLTIASVSGSSPVYKLSPAALDFAAAVTDTGCDIVAINAQFSNAGEKIATLTLPPTLLTIGSGTFRSAKPTNDIVIPPSVTHIGANAFTACTGGHLTLGGGNSLVIDQWAFSDSTFTGITMLDGVTVIGDSAFRACKNMSGDLVVPETVTSIGQSAFYQNTLSGSLTIGGGTSLTIGQDAFCDCGFKGTINFREGGATDIGFRSFQNCQFTGDLLIPNGVISVGQSAFNNCKSMKGNLIIGDSVTAIGQQAFWDCAFEGFLTVGAGVTSIGYQAFGYSRFIRAYLGCGPSSNLGANLFDVNYVQTVLVAPGKGWENAVQYVNWPGTYHNGKGYDSAEDALNATDARYHGSFGYYIAVGYGEPPISYTVYFDANGGNGSMAPQQRTFGSTVPLPANTFTPRMMGMRFAGWATTPGGEVEYDNEDVCPTLVSVGTFSVTLYAKWTNGLGGGNPTTPTTEETPVIAFISVDNEGVNLEWDIAAFAGKTVHGYVIRHSPDLTTPANTWDVLNLDEEDSDDAGAMMVASTTRKHKFTFSEFKNPSGISPFETSNANNDRHFFKVFVTHDE